MDPCRPSRPTTGWVFPDVADLRSTAPPTTSSAMGADLEPGTLLAAYRRGLFPMPADDPARRAMLWWSPVQRGVLPLDGLRVSRSLRQSVRRIEVRVDTAFDEVIRACADPARDGAWIDERDPRRPTRGCTELGWAHSVEAWRDGELVGGLYGVAIGGLFAGESMFHRVTRRLEGRARRRWSTCSATSTPTGGCSTCSGPPSTSRRSAWSRGPASAYLATACGAPSTSRPPLPASR